MAQASPAAVVGPCVALAGFAVAIVAGIGVDNPIETVLGSALVAMACCFAVGSLVGWMLEKLIIDHIKRVVQLRMAAAVKSAVQSPNAEVITKASPQ